MSDQQEPVAKRSRRISLRTIAIIILLIGFAAFCVGNSVPVTVWPFRMHLPLYAVIALSFVVGLAIGWLVRGVATGRAPSRERS